MSHEAVLCVLKCYPHGGNQGLLAVALAEASNADGIGIFKSVATLATDAKMSERTIQRMIPRLVASGWLVPTCDGAGGKGRSNTYNINSDWMAAAHFEMGTARQERRQPRPIAPEPFAPKLSTKGDSLSPFTQTPKGDKFEPKGDKFEPKGDKFEPKGDTHGCHPNIEHEHRTNNPLPPKGDETDFQNFDPDALLSKLIASHPRHDTSDTTAASRALKALAPRLASSGERLALMAAIEREAAGDAWLRDGKRFAPKLSKWLRGYGLRLGLPIALGPRSESAQDLAWLTGDALKAATRARTESQAARLGLPPYDSFALAYYQKNSKPCMFGLYQREVDRLTQRRLSGVEVDASDEVAA